MINCVLFYLVSSVFGFHAMYKLGSFESYLGKPALISEFPIDPKVCAIICIVAFAVIFLLEAHDYAHYQWWQDYDTSGLLNSISRICWVVGLILPSHI